MTREQAAGSAAEEPPLRNQFNYNDRGTQARPPAVVPRLHASCRIDTRPCGP